MIDNMIARIGSFSQGALFMKIKTQKESGKPHNGG